MSLEVVLVVPVLMLLALFVLWAGRGGRAALMADLAAEEAATAAAVTCEDDDDECEGFVTDVLSARPGMDFLCIGGPRPDGDAVVRYEEVLFPAVAGEEGPEAKGAAVVGVRFVCETDGAVAPLAGVFPTVAFRGQASEVAILQGAPRAGVADVEVTEGDVDGDGNPVPLVFTVTLDAPASGDVVFTYEVEPTEETRHMGEGTDYTLEATRSVTVLDGQTRAEIRVGVVDDELHEATESLKLTLRVVDPTPGILDDPLPAVFKGGAESVTAVGTILDNDPEPVLTVSDAGFEPEVREGGGGALVFTVALGPVGRDVVVIYRTADVDGGGGATGGDPCVDDDDYSHSHGELTFGPLDAERTEDVDVVLCDDLLGEPDETLELRLELVGGGAQMAPVEDSVRCQAEAHGGGDGDSCAVGLISDDEPRLAVVDTCMDVAGLGNGDEVDQAGIEAVHACVREGAGTLVFTVERRDGGSGEHPEVTVTYVTEPNPETFEGTHDATAGGPGSPVDCAGSPLRLAGAGEPHDFVPAWGTLTIEADAPDSRRTVAVEIVDDALDEHPETFWLRLCRASDNAWVEQGEQWGRGLIADDDDPPAVSASDATEVVEGADGDGDGDPDPAVFMVSLDTPSGREVTVDYYTDHRSLYEGADPPVAVPGDVEALTAEPGEDYVQGPKEPGDDRAKVIFEAGETGPKEARVAVVDDDVYEPDDETLAVRLLAYNARFADGSGSCAPAGPGGDNTGNDCALGTITDNDAPPFVRVSDAAATEGETLVFTVSLVDADGSSVDADGGPVVSGRDMTVDYSVHHRSTKDVDFEPPLAGDVVIGAVEIKAGESSVEVPLGTLDDSLDELDEEVFELRLGIPDAAVGDVELHPTAAAGGCVSVADGDAGIDGIDGCGVGLISDDDDPPYLRIDDAADVVEGADSDGDGALDRAVFTVSLVDIDGNTTDAGGDRLVSGRDVTVAYRTDELTDPGDGCDAVNEPATAGEDFAAAADVTVTIREGAPSAPITVEVLDDDDDECPREVFLVRLDGAHGDSVGFKGIHAGGIATGAVIDDDDIEVRVVADVDCEEGVDACAAEGNDGDPANAVAFTLGLFDGDTGDAVSAAVDVTVQYCTVGGTDDHAAVRGTDFATEASCPDGDWVDFTIDAGVKTAVLALDTVPDDVYEHDETFLLRLQATSGSNAGVGDHAAVGAVLDDDDPPRVSVADAAAAEGAEVVFELRLLDAGGDEAQIGRAVTVYWATAGTGAGIGHATGGPSGGDGADYVTAQGTVVFDPEGADPAAQTVSVATVDERVDEDAETFELRLTLPDGEEATIDTGPDPCEPEPAGAAEAPSDDCAVGTIEPDGDPAPLAVLSGAAAAEGDELVFTVTLVDPDDPTEAHPSGRQVTVGARTAGPAAADAVSNAHGTAYRGACGAALGHDPLFGFLEAVADFEHTEPEADFEPGDTTAQMRVATCDDPLDEADSETMHLELDPDATDNADIGDPGAEGRRGAGTITDNDPTPAAVVDDAAATEGDPVEFTPRLVHPDDSAEDPADQRTALSDRHIAIGYHTYSDPSSADFAATPDGPDRDYTAVPQTPPSQTIIHAGRDRPAAGPIEIATRADGTLEGAEKFQLRLTLHSDQPATLADRTAAGTITDGCLDPRNPQHTAPPLTIDAPSTVGEQDAPGSLTIRWPIPFCEFRTNVFELRVQHGTTDEDDFNTNTHAPITGTSSVDGNPGDIESSLRMRFVDDDVDEADETFHYQVRWSDRGNYAWNMGDNEWVSAEITIIDDDPTPAVVVDDASGPEGTDIVFTPRLVHPDDTAKDPADQRTALSDQAITVEYHTYGDPDSPNLGATPGDDYAHVPETPTQSVTVPALATAAESIAIAARLDDHKDEGDEKFQLRLALPEDTRAQLARGGIAVGTITECIDPATHQQGGVVAEIVPAFDGDPQALEDAGHITFELTFEPRLCDGALAHIYYWHENTGPGAIPIDNSDPMQDDGAESGYDFIDFEDGERSWIIQGGDNGFEIEVPLIDDHIDEPLTEFLTLAVAWADTMPEAYQDWREPWSETQVIGFIIDDDDLIVTVDHADAVEGSPVSFEVHATPSQRRVNVSYNTFERLEGDAIARPGDCDTAADADYEHTERTLVFEPVTDPRAYDAGSRVTKTIDIETCDDDRPESNETFLLQSALTVDDPILTYPDADVPDPADPANRGTLHGATRQGTITDDDNVSVSVSSPGYVFEGDPVEFEVTLSGQPAETVTVQYATEDSYDGPGAATGGADYRPLDSSDAANAARPLVFEPGGPLTQTVPVETIENDPVEGDEVFRLRLTGAENANLARGDYTWGTGTITDCLNPRNPDHTAPPLTLEVTSEVDEADGGSYSIEWGTPICRLSYVIIGVEPIWGTAVWPDDFQRNPGWSTDYTPDDDKSPGFDVFAGTTGRDGFSMYILDDEIAEEDETFDIRVRWQRGRDVQVWDLGDNDWVRATVTIIDNDGVSVSVSSPEYASEGDHVEFEITLNGEPAETVTVDVATADPGPDHRLYEYAATAGDDYTPVALHTVTFDPDDPDVAARTSRTVRVQTRTDDVYFEHYEYLLLRLSNPQNAVLDGDGDGDGHIEATGRIREACIAPDPDTTPPIRAWWTDGDSVEEGDEINSSFQFPAPACESGHVAVYAVRNNVTTDNDDFPFNPGPVTGEDWPVDDWYFEVRPRSIVTRDDEAVEGPETFEVIWTWSRQVLGMTSQEFDAALDDIDRLAELTGTIIDNDGLSVSVSSPEPVPEGEDVEFEVTLNGEPAETVTVQYATEDAPGGAGAATAGVDYTPLDSRDAANTARPLVFEPGEPLTRTVPVATIADAATDEPDETFRLRLTEADNAVLAGGDATYGTGTILDNDCVDPGDPDHPVPTLSGPRQVIHPEEGPSQTTTIRLDPPFCESWTEAIDHTHYMDPGYEDSTDADDFLPQTIPIRHGSSWLQDTTAGQAEFRHLFDLADDDIAEGDETFTEVVNWSASMCSKYPDYCNQPDVTITHIIEDDDCIKVGSDEFESLGPFELIVPDRIEVTEGDAFEVLVRTDFGAFCETSVAHTRAGVLDTDSDAEFRAGDADVHDITGSAAPVFTGPGERLNGRHFISTGYIEPGFRVHGILEDELDEHDETFRLRWTWSHGLPADHLALEWFTTVTIIDDDPLPVVSVSDGIGPDGEEGGVEGGTLEFTVSLDHASGRTVTVHYSFNEVTATSADHDGSPGTLTFAPGDLTRTVTVALHDDGDGDETFHMRLSDPVNAELGDFIGEGTILSSDRPVVSVSNGIGPDGGLGGVEGEALVFTVSLDRASEHTVTVDYYFNELTTASNIHTSDYFELSDGPRPDGVDHDGRPGTLTFEPGDPLTQTVTVELLDDSSQDGDIGFSDMSDAQVGDWVQPDFDSFQEADERFQIILHEPANVDLGDRIGEGLILGAPVASLDGAIVVDEGVGAIPIEVRFSRPIEASDLPVQFHLRVLGGTAVTFDHSWDPADPPAWKDVFLDAVDIRDAAAGQHTYVVSDVVVVDDLNDEEDDTLVLELNPERGVLAVFGDKLEITITDNDDPPAVGFASGDRNYQITAGQSVTVELELSAPSAREVTVQLAAEDGTAQAGTHYYFSLPRTVTFAPRQQRKSVTIYTPPGSIDAGESKHFTVRLADPGNAVLDTGPGASLADHATVRITGADVKLYVPQRVRVQEDAAGGSYVWSLSLASAVEWDVTVDWVAQETDRPTGGRGRAVLGEDFTALSGTVTIPAGDTWSGYQTNSHIIDDDVAEGVADEEFVLYLTVSGADPEPGRYARVLISDDD